MEREKRLLFKNLQEVELKEFSLQFKDEMIKDFKEIFDELPQVALNEFNFITDLMRNNLYGYVYFLHNKLTDLVKIGYTSDLTRRMSDIKEIYQNYVGINPDFELYGLIYASNYIIKKLEKSIHEYYDEYRKYGEWFKVSFDQILIDWFSNTNFITINNVIVNIDDYYEWEYFKNVEKEYNFSWQEIAKFIEYKYNIALPIKENGLSTLFSENNKMFKIYSHYMNNKKGLSCKLIKYKNNKPIVRTYTFGNMNNKYYSILDLKRENFKREDVIKALEII